MHSPLKIGDRLLRESSDIFVRFAVCCEVLHSADSVQDDKLLSADSFLNTRAAKIWDGKGATPHSKTLSRRRGYLSLAVPLPNFFKVIGDKGQSSPFLF